MRINSQFLTILIVIVGFLRVFAQDPPADTTFFNPTFGSASQTINPSTGTGDDSPTLINAINAVNSLGGGKVIVNAGTYRILEVPLKSNVHIEVDSNVTFLPYNYTANNKSLFDADSNSGISNFSIVGVGGNFNVDFTSLQPDARIRVINFNFCSNFRVANFNIDDNNTVFAGLIFGSNHTTISTPNGNRIDSIRGVPNGGIIENISITNAHYGYGLIQTQSGKNLLFRDLSGVGGATLRLETGYSLIQYVELIDFEDLKLDNIWGRNIECTNGQSALQLSPHTLDQGYFNVSGVVGNSCEATVVWSSGFTTDEEEANGLTPGSYDSTSKIRDVTSTFGQNAQLHKSKRLRYIPCALRVERSGGIGIATTLNVDGESRLGPAIGAVIRQADKLGDYNLDFPETEVTANGYNIEAYYLPPRAFFTDSYDDYEICNESVDGVSFWIPVEERDTPNPRNPLENGALGINDYSDSELTIYPNPTSGLLNFSIPHNGIAKTVQIRDMLGKEIANDTIENKKTIDLSILSKGVYLLYIDNNFKQKIILY
ncbi:T9SS type A sorting domain-containing protein [uncultured Algibacter sp.]|uniref:T9SS type A sorting domain-containing protein n=1 Tax=uncultured Algibacter sp. TaxID=298659 RepID=UPI00261EB15E|nr:T9SS type A sorting domain-containing protein [uncultured Algibacter sp.]